MSRDVLPANADPVLMCQGAGKCGWMPHRFVRSDRSLAHNGILRQIFACGGCAHERVYGVVDAAYAGRAVD